MPPVPSKFPVPQCRDTQTRVVRSWSTSLWEQGPSGVAQQAGIVPARDPGAPGKAEEAPGSLCPPGPAGGQGAKPHVSPRHISLTPYLGTKGLRGRATRGSGGWWHHGCSARYSRPSSGGTAGSPAG